MKLNHLAAAAGVLALAMAGPALAQISPGAPVPVDPAAATLTAEQVTELQTLLTQLGFDTQGIDGVVGPATRAAITAAQQSLGLVADGEPTLELLDRLREQAAAAAPPAPAPVPATPAIPGMGG